MYLTDFINWLSTHKPILAYLGAGSIIIFFLSIAALPILSGLIPSDYFCSPNRPSRLEKMPWWLGLPAILVKNFLGVLLILAGIIMLFIPGQGLVTILAGLVLTNFPGKYRLEKYLVSKKNVFRFLNWLRAKSNKPPLCLK